MKKYLSLAAGLLLCCGVIQAQEPEDDWKVRAKNLPKIPKIEFNEIAGAPRLSQPKLIVGKKFDVRVDKHGNAYPALMDYNKDGKLDLLVGEFETGEKGSFVKVFLNVGTSEKPKYTGEFEYLKDTEGNELTAYAW